MTKESGGISDQVDFELEHDKPLNIAVLISNKGRGSNLQALIDAIEKEELNARISLVVSDRPNAFGLKRAEKAGIPRKVRQLKYRRSTGARDAYSRQLAEELNRNGVQVAVLAGFMTLLSPSYVETFDGVTINVHPGSIPDREDEPDRYPDGTPIPWNRGMIVEKAVANFLDKPYAVSSIHIATEETDFGPVLERGMEKVRPGDTVDTLYTRLKIREHEGLIRALNNPRRIFESKEQ